MTQRRKIFSLQTDPIALCRLYPLQVQTQRASHSVDAIGSQRIQSERNRNRSGIDQESFRSRSGVVQESFRNRSGIDQESGRNQRSYQVPETMVSVSLYEFTPIAVCLFWVKRKQ